MNILLTGGTGFIGGYLMDALTEKGHRLTILTRKKRESKHRLVSYREWDARSMPPALGLYDAIINLAGASIGEGPWTEKRKQEILDSRLHATQACVDFIAKSPNPPKVFVSASAIGYYGAFSSALKTEGDPPGNDFPAVVTRKWEEVALQADCRTVCPRIGVVLGEGGGVLEKVAPIYRWCLGGKFGSGKQGFPWVHIKDVVGAILFALENESLSGPVNVVGPEIVDQATFSDTLGTVVARPDLFVVPKFVLQLILGEQSLLLWGGQKASPAKLQEAGYEFAYKELEAALREALNEDD